jgi:hypothetical protein
VRFLIAVTSYFPDVLERYCHETIRETWGKDVTSAGIDLKFFIPKGSSIPAEYKQHTDEELTDVSDRYDHIQHAIKEILRWSIQKGYDFTYLCCNDTFVCPRNLIKSGFEDYDYFGTYYPPLGEFKPGEEFSLVWYDKIIPNMFLWMNGGLGFILSKKASEIIVANTPNEWTADVWIGQLLGPYTKVWDTHSQSKQIKIGHMKRDDVYWHYKHSLNEIRYQGLHNWMHEMYQQHGDRSL